MPLTNFSRRKMMRLLAKPALFAASILLMGSLALPASAQFFTSGSTGANGPFPPNGGVLPSGTNGIVLNLETGDVAYYLNSTVIGTASVGPPTAGVFNFTTFTVPVSVFLATDSRNRPAQFLTTGDVAINANLFLYGAAGAGPSSINGGAGGAGGPGGYNGGTGGSAGESPTLGTPGAGPSGGGVGQSGTLTTSNQQLQPLFGGSGGGGGNPTTVGGYGGGGGGGALLIASSGSITINSVINADGGAASGGAGVGSGGAVRLIANTISGPGQIYVRDGSGQATKGGYVRTEANTNTFSSGAVIGASGITFTSVPSPPFPTGLGTITIQSIGGVAVPANSGGGLPSKVDITFPTPQTAPVTVVVATTNIPLNTLFTLTLATTTAAQGGTGQAITATGTINSGTVAAGSGSTTISLPVGTSVIDVIAAFQLPTTQAMQLEKAIGEKVARAEVRSRLGGEAGMDYITVSGRRINASSVNSLR
jgi:hypothetical protein